MTAWHRGRRVVVMHWVEHMFVALVIGNIIGAFLHFRLLKRERNIYPDKSVDELRAMRFDRSVAAVKKLFGRAG